MFEKGCPAGKAGSCCEVSINVFNSSTVGARQPFCPPTSFVAHRATERLQTSCSRSGSCSQISPVWLSFTAAPPSTKVNLDEPEESAAYGKPVGVKRMPQRLTIPNRRMGAPLSNRGAYRKRV